MRPQCLPQPGPRNWAARWIWPSAVPDDEANVYCLFRRTFDLARAPAGHRLFVSADRLYRLYVNGELLGIGPPPSQPWFHYYDEYDLGRRLRKGKNCLAVVVHHAGDVPGWPVGRDRGGLLLEVTDARGAPVVHTDATWRARRADAWRKSRWVGNAVTPYQEIFDARLEPAGWRAAGFDDRAWPAAAVITARRRPGADAPPLAGPWSKLVPRGIPFMAGGTLLPEQVAGVEESVDLYPDSTDLASGLSMVGRPVQYTRCDNAANLCLEDGCAVFQGSVAHLDLDFGSVYTPAVVLDFGRIVTAHVRLDLDGIDGGVVDIGYAERLLDGHFNISTTPDAGLADRYIMKDGPQVFETFTWRAFRFLKLRFRSCPAPVTVQGVHALVSTYPYEERGKFVSDDAVLNGVFEISRATVRLCSNDYLMDSPWREKGQWLGDVALVILPAIHACFGDTALPRKFLVQAGQNQHPTGLLANVSNHIDSTARWETWSKSIPDYSLWWLKGLLDQFLYTGDRPLLDRLYPQALRILDTHLDYLNDRALVENMPYWMLIDWADVEKNGICTAYNAIFYHALGCLGQLARYRGDGYTAGLTRELRVAIRSVFHATLFDETRGCYADARIGGELSAKISEHGNLTPVWAGLCDKVTARKLVVKVFGAGGKNNPAFTEAQPFYMAVVLPALAGVGRLDLALDLIRRRWGRRMLGIGATSTFECWQQDGRWLSGSFTGLVNSHSHAWSACPADFLIRHLLGLKILEPGCKKIQLAPKITDFNYRVVFPTPRGCLEAACRDGKVNLSLPDSISVQYLKGGE